MSGREDRSKDSNSGENSQAYRAVATASCVPQEAAPGPPFSGRGTLTYLQDLHGVPTVTEQNRTLRAALGTA